MTEQKDTSEEVVELTPAQKLREPFAPNQISKLPKPTRQQTEAVRADFKNGMRCKECGGWHHPAVVHLDYVGHAAVTDRLLDVDPMWDWQPLAIDEYGLPVVDRDGGLWIRLTINGTTRLGYGDAGSKAGPDAMKERIGDAIRNAAMRFGVALELWHKGILHEAEAVPIQLATEEQLAKLGEWAQTDWMTDGLKAWLKYGHDKITFDQAEYALGELQKKQEAGE